MIAAGEGFVVHPDKTRVSRAGGRQQVTGLVVNGEQGPRVARETKRQIRAALHNLARGKRSEGETLSRIAGFIAYIQMSEPELGKRLRAQLAAL